MYVIYWTEKALGKYCGHTYYSLSLPVTFYLGRKSDSYWMVPGTWKEE